ncbi:Acyl-CoA dehydrogenase [Rhodovulum sp. PH10]|uniref:acyl-CoA dehydrogenase n=1 Tax=Rhodovulum sp. PH10 TaxID=1187851 RepID=UPI00027C2DE8|nr:acyl-CoA dehydrogenase [Rhodovulum sp. PH10]EJW09941.1 Acyl-CoA dehydrogenase [Rhodovulum sp. PH10]
MPYRAPVSDIKFTLDTVAGLSKACADGLFGDLSDDLVAAVLEEAGKFATEVIAPLNRVGDTHGTPFSDGAVKTPPGWKEAYTAWAAAGWNGLAAPPEWGGQGLPTVLNAACFEMWNGASMAFGVGPLLTMSAIDLLAAHGSEALKATYLAKLVSGEWMGTMQLTESQAGSDVGALRTKAERAGDGTYRITGEKIFITYGEHDLTENIVHMVLARLPDAPPGARGLSLFLVPKFLVNPDGSLGARNDVRAQSIEHKLGMHASPTCTMVYGDHGGATGFLIGEENRGIACMFTMMNAARLDTGLQGVAVAEAATQLAFDYARERHQGRLPGMPADQSVPIIAYPDVKRMLLRMKSRTKAARAICYATAMAIDRARRIEDPAARKAAEERAALLTPVAKAFSADIGAEVASLAMQVHGGMGYIEETGIAQLYRDVRVAQIYEGTNGIQAIDLVTRKLPAGDGKPFAALLGELRGIVAEVEGENDPGFGATGRRLETAVDSLQAAGEWLVERLADAPDAALAGASLYLRLFGFTAGGCLLAREALAALHLQDGAAADAPSRIALARFFAESTAVLAPGFEKAITEGGESVTTADAVFAA